MKPNVDYWKWEPGSGNAPAGFHFESHNGVAHVVRDGATLTPCCCVHAPEQHWHAGGCEVVGCGCKWRWQ